MPCVLVPWYPHGTPAKFKGHTAPHKRLICLAPRAGLSPPKDIKGLALKWEYFLPLNSNDYFLTILSPLCRSNRRPLSRGRGLL